MKKWYYRIVDEAQDLIHALFIERDHRIRVTASVFASLGFFFAVGMQKIPWIIVALWAILGVGFLGYVIYKVHQYNKKESE